MEVKNENLHQIVAQLEPRFTELASVHNAVTFRAEALFAKQIIDGSDYLAGVARGAPDTLRNAIFNVAALGLTLNPAVPLAYLVPRKGRVCLDIGYRGLVHLAAEARAIAWAVAELVHEKDTYETRGVGHEPIHRREPFTDRGRIVGAYCVAKTHGGEFIVTEMSAEEIFSIRDRSESWKAGKSSPWKSDESEMIKKTVIRRASKSWPLVDTSPRFTKALEVADGADPIDLSPPVAPNTDKTAALLSDIAMHLKALGKSETDYAVYLTRQNKRTITSLKELTPAELQNAETFLRGTVKAQIDRALKVEASREKAS